MIKKGIIVVVMALAVFVLQACSGGQSNIFTYVIDESYTEYITMGTSADYPPYEWPMEVDGKTTLVGIDIEIAKLIAKAVGKNLQVINKGFDFLLEDLENGKVDFVIAALSPTPERAQQVDFSNIYYEAVQVVLIKADKLETYTSIDSLDQQTFKIGAQLGSIQQDLVEETFAVAFKQYLQSVNDLVYNLQSGQLDAVVIEEPVAQGFVTNQNGLAISSITIGEPDGGSAVAVQKGNAELLAIINAVIAELIATGKLDEIISNAVNLNS